MLMTNSYSADKWGLYTTTQASSDGEEEGRSALISLLTPPLWMRPVRTYVFALEEYERGETDLIEMEVDTGDAHPRLSH